MPAPIRNLDLVAVVASPDAVRSPLGDVCGAVVRVEVLQDRGPPEPLAVVGAITLGDLLALDTSEGERLQIVVRRAKLAFPSGPLVSLERVPAELVHIVAGAPGRGALHARAHALRCGDAVRLQATIEPDGMVRGDLSQIVITPV